MTDRRSATLHGYGRLPWTDLTAALSGVSTAWADYDGFHIGACPAKAPPYTHLWAWADGWLLRARIDGTCAIAGILETGGSAPAGLIALRSEPVRYLTRAAHTWPTTEKRVGRLSPEVAGQHVTLYEVDGEHPLTFVRLEG
ncbi:hypothetical protein [Phytohabitans aurantiacus]|uniref:Uncharacterized protein n=1 Tax=Phytohabitans aurantiacus TaxID=3016789 RepID=A0ABQ5R291_9ACTN|nr:hypothetical protein [Phytohabitans aurantiacus]GLI00902.1 hypothetical protein Pa4123_61780 [Phytohabitans aurantiacus]